VSPFVGGGAEPEQYQLAEKCARLLPLTVPGDRVMGRAIEQLDNNIYALAPNQPTRETYRKPSRTSYPRFVLSQCR
jgi:hypothetical protein